MAGTAPAQVVSRGVPGVTSQGVVINVRELAAREAARPQRPLQPKFIHRQPHPPTQTLTPEMMRRVVATELTAAAAPLPAPETPAPKSPAPVSSFAALGDNNTAIPPDTHGAAGPNHLMVALNTQVAFQTRTGSSTGTTVSLDSFWSGVGGSPNVFDPKVLYDHLAGRWMFTAMANAELATSAVLIGVSQTNDPTGNWNLFKVDADATDTNWADYPSMGYNKDWIAVTVNMFPNAGGSFAGAKIYVFKKADLYNNTTPLSTHTVLNAAAGFTLVPAITYDGSLATLYLIDNGWANSTTSFVRLNTVTGAVGSEVLTEQTAFAGVTGTKWDNSQPSGGADFAPQLNSTDKIDAGDARIQNVVYRNGSLWTAHTIFLPAGGATRSAVQWWEIATNGTVTQRGRLDDSDGEAPHMFYGYPSIAVNADEDVLVGFTSFSADQYATASYAFRANTDTASTLQSVVNFKDGEDTYFKTFGGSSNRWGDYSNTVVDPANDTDFWTIQEYAESDSGLAETYPDRWGTWWAKVSPNAEIRRRGQVTSE